MSPQREDWALLDTSTKTNPKRRKPARVTIGQLAAELGLTKGTVSRALNGYPDIAEATRLRVRRKAEEIGYAPLAHAQAITTGRVRAMGLVLQIGDADAQRPFLADFLAGIASGASAESWTLTVANAEDEHELLDTTRRLVDEHKADGFILPRTKLCDPRVALLREMDVPFVLYGRTEDQSGCAWFDMLSEDAMDEAVTRLHALGHRRIGFIGGGAGYTYATLRRQGYDRAIRRLGVPPAPDLIIENAVTVQHGAAAARRLLAEALPPTALVCATDSTGIGAMRAIRAAGLDVGRDVSVIAYDGISDCALSHPPLTTFQVDTRAAGARLAALLIRRCRGEAPETLRETAHVPLILRDSDGPPRLSSQELRAELARNTPTGPTSKGGFDDL